MQATMYMAYPEVSKEDQYLLFLIFNLYNLLI